MSQEYWKKLDELFHAALAQEGQAREEFLTRACGTNQELLSEVWSLLASVKADSSFMEQSAFGAGARLIVEDGVSKFLGQRIGSHRIISELGRGGMGTVYLAVRDDEEFQQRVALKIVREGIASPSLIERFRRERQILANLNHPHIARLLDGGTIAGSTPYFVMEYVRGQNVVEYAARRNLSVNERLNLFLKICDAVAHAHSQGIIHRDLKPTNVLVTAAGEPKLLDFGIARVLQDNERETAQTLTGFNLFTPEYSSPEQTRGQTLAATSDIYSLGVLLYELLTKTHPFDFANRSPLEIARIVCESEPERPSTAIYTRKDTIAENEFQLDENKVYETSRLLRGDLDNIILMAMRKEPARRYRTVGEFSNDIKDYLRNLPVKARPNSAFYRSAKFVRRNRAASVLACLLAISIGLFAVTVLLPAQAAKVYPPSIIADDEAVKLTSIPVTDDFLKFAADGKSVFFVSNKQLYSVGIDGQQLAPVKTSAAILRLAQSPNGKLFAFGAGDGIYFGDKTLTNRKKITNCSAGRFSWASDNQRIAFGCMKDGNVNVFVANIDGHDERQLTHLKFCSDPSFSPDGERIVYACETNDRAEGNLDIYTMDVDGTTEVRLTHEPSADRLPVWSPDGNHIAFVSNRTGRDEIYVMNPEGGDLWRLTNSRGSSDEPAWSSEGRYIAFRNNREGNPGIYLMNVEARILAERNADESQPAFSPAGRQMIFSSNRHGQSQIFRRDVDGADLRQLTWGNNGSGFPRFSPDGAKIVFNSNRDGLDELYLMNADGTNQVRLTGLETPSVRPAWSFDGRKIAFVRTIEANNEIFTLDLFSGKETRLTTDPSDDDFPSWTPDGRIVFFSDRSGSNEVYLMNGDGSQLLNLTNNRANDGEMTVSRNGKIVFNSNRTHTTELWLMNLDGSGLTQLTNTAPGGYNSVPQFSANGSQIIYNSYENDRDVIRVLQVP